jgi:hypothetical protein
MPPSSQWWIGDQFDVIAKLQEVVLDLVMDTLIDQFFGEKEVEK